MNKQREKFESFAKLKGWDISPETNPHYKEDVYVDYGTSKAWMVWQSAAEIFDISEGTLNAMRTAFSDRDSDNMKEVLKLEARIKELEALVDTPIFNLAGFTIRQVKKDRYSDYWIQSPAGEGMGIKSGDLQKYLNTWWADLF